MPPYTGLIWHYTFIKKKKKKKFFFFFFYIFTFKCISLHILAAQFLRNITNSPDLVVNKSGYLYNLSLGRLLEGDPLKCCLYHKQQALAQIALQATFHTICEICHPILLFGTILLLNLCDLPPYTLIWHYMFIRHTRVYTAYSFCLAQCNYTLHTVSVLRNVTIHCIQFLSCSM